MSHRYMHKRLQLCKSLSTFPASLIVWTNTVLFGVSDVNRTNSHEFDANRFRPDRDGLVCLEGDTDIAKTDG